MSESLYNCLVSRLGYITAKMRHWWNKIFFVIIRVMIFLNQMLFMAPFIYTKKPSQKTVSRKGYPQVSIPTRGHYRTHRVITGMAIGFCVILSVAAPFLVKRSTALYGNTRKQQDNIFSIIAGFTVATDILSSMLILAAQIWHREKLVVIVNSLADIREKMYVFEKNIVSFKIFLALLLKSSLTLYEMLLSVPFLITASSRLSNESIFSYISLFFIQHFSTIYALIVFVTILLLLTISQQMEKQLKKFENISNNKKMIQLIGLQNDIHKIIRLVVQTSQFGTFLILLLNFVTILCNVYAMLDYYITLGVMYRTFITYILATAVELYSLILVTYLCERSQHRVRDLFLMREEQYFLKPPSAFTFVDSSALWPLHDEFCILGLFTLNNTFALFLLAYSTNFILIIVEFALTKSRHRNTK